MKKGKKYKVGLTLAGIVANWFFLSMIVHAATGGGIYYWFVMREPTIIADLDLSATPLVPTIPHQGHSKKQPEAWLLPPKKKSAPPPVVPQKVEIKEDVVKAESVAIPSYITMDVPGDLEGQYVSANDLFRKPRWVRNFITTRDYPVVARQAGKDGRVTMLVFIDSEGHVKNARLLEGSYEAFNEVALRKVKDAVFTPAYNEKGKPVSCKVTLPIRFELR